MFMKESMLRTGLTTTLQLKVLTLYKISCANSIWEEKSWSLIPPSCPTHPSNFTYPHILGTAGSQPLCQEHSYSVLSSCSSYSHMLSWLPHNPSHPRQR